MAAGRFSHNSQHMINDAANVRRHLIRVPNLGRCHSLRRCALAARVDRPVRASPRRFAVGPSCRMMPRRPVRPEK